VVAILVGLTPLLGGYMARVYQGEAVALTRVLGAVERRACRLFGVASGDEQDWKQYARSVLLFSAAGWLLLYLILRTQGIDPLNPESFHSGPWNLSFNTASSFVSNTSWQFYAGETTLSYFSQMAGITVASFTSCATGMAVAVALAHVRRLHDRVRRDLRGAHVPDRPAARSARAGTRLAPGYVTQVTQETTVFTRSARRRAVSVRDLDDRAPKIECMDIVAVLLGIISFAILYALIFGIDRI
jgi:hypothetical protein